MNQAIKQEIIIDQDMSGKRLDVFLSILHSGYSRSFFQKAIVLGEVLVNNKTEKSRYVLKTGDSVKVNLSEPEISLQDQAEDIPLDILFEDKNVIVINKQAGLVVHPAAGNQTGTLVNALMFRFPEIKSLKSAPGPFRPGIVHRLDKDTTGVMIVAKNARAMHCLAKQIQNRTAQKSYFALVHGWPKESKGILTSFLGRHPQERKKMAEVGESRGREAVSEYRVLKRFFTPQNDRVCLLEYTIKTGRTHQIRVQSAALHHPVLGDSIYGNKESQKVAHKLGITRQMLHSSKLSIYLPDVEVKKEFMAPMPPDFTSALCTLREDMNK